MDDPRAKHLNIRPIYGISETVRPPRFVLSIISDKCRLLLFVIVLMITGGLGRLALAQSPTFGLGKAPTAEEIRAWDIAIRPEGKELPQGRGTAKEGAPHSLPRSALHVTVLTDTEAVRLS